MRIQRTNVAMGSRQARLALALGVISLSFIGAGSPAPAADSPASSPRVWKYKIEAQSIRGTEIASANLELEAFDLTVDGDRFFVCSITGNDEVLPGYFPMGAIRGLKSGDAEIAFENPRSAGPLTTRVHPVLFPNVNPKRLAAPATGEEIVEVLQLSKFEKIRVSYKSGPLPDNATQILYEEAAVGTPEKAIGTTIKNRLAKYERRLKFAADDHRLLEGTWAWAEEKTIGPKVTTLETRLRATLLDLKPLDAAEGKKVLDEYLAIQAAASPAFQGAKEALKEAETAMASYQQKYPKGRFASALVAIEIAVATHRATAEGRERPVELIQKKVLNHPAPDFTIKDLEGNEVTLSALKEKVVVLSCWSIACKECRAEAPHLNELYEKYKDRGLVVLGLNAYNESPETGKEFRGQLGITYPLLMNGAHASRFSYFAPDFPATYWIDKSGKVVHFEIGWKIEKSQENARALETRAKALLGL
ncbi:MAG: TlpA family protein disulfide reductase [Planctomycetes bacterium]|nr:TlpA family protein disulfide reductase [Planctomycetota bacterium]